MSIKFLLDNLKGFWYIQPMSITKCPACDTNIELNPASMLGKVSKGKKKTMTPAAIEARQKNGKKGGRPKKEEKQ